MKAGAEHAQSASSGHHAPAVKEARFFVGQESGPDGGFEIE
jgi:hypothetical protein